MDGTGPGGGWLAPFPAGLHSSEGPDDSTPSSSARNGRRGEAAVEAVPGSRARGPRAVPPPDSRRRIPPPTPVARMSTQHLQSLSHLGEQVGKPSRQRRRTPDEHHFETPLEQVLLTTIGLPDPPSRSIALHGLANPAAHGEPDPASPRAAAPQDHEAPALVAIAPLEERLDFCGPPEPFAPGEGKHAWRLTPHAPIRRRGACALSRAGASARSVPLASSSADGSRVSCCGGAGSAERSFA